MDRLSTTTEGTRGSEKSGLNKIQHDVIHQFKNAILDELGCVPEDIIADGLQRFGKNKTCWYTFHLNSRAAGSFGDWKTGVKYTWKQSGKFMPLSEFQRQEFKAQCQRDAAQRKAEQDAKHREAASKAVDIWSHAPPAPANHPYQLKKRINPLGARLGRENTLVIPLFNAKKELVNLQFISEAGGKRFLSGGEKKGCFYEIGDPTERILICEGYATGASLHDDSGYLTVVAFDAGNLKQVAIVVKSLYPDAEIIVCGDNDESGVGQKAAMEAALAVSGKFIIPEIVGMDFNDMLTMEGVSWVN